jgi:hypothetical protein
LVILTSDGVHFVDNQVMQMVIQTAKDSGLVVRRLIEIAKWCGGQDNASTVTVMPFPSQFQPSDDPEAIQIWDPFGELQIIISEVTGSVQAGNTPLFNEKLFVTNEPQKSKRPAKPTKKKKQAKRKIAAKKVPRNEDKNSEKKDPQLNIYFNGDTGKNNNG